MADVVGWRVVCFFWAVSFSPGEMEAHLITLYNYLERDCGEVGVSLCSHVTSDNDRKWPKVEPREV